MITWKVGNRAAAASVFLVSCLFLQSSVLNIDQMNIFFVLAEIRPNLIQRRNMTNSHGSNLCDNEASKCNEPN